MCERERERSREREKSELNNLFESECGAKEMPTLECATSDNHEINNDGVLLYIAYIHAHKNNRRTKTFPIIETQRKVKIVQCVVGEAVENHIRLRGEEGVGGVYRRRTTPRTICIGMGVCVRFF